MTTPNLTLEEMAPEQRRIYQDKAPGRNDRGLRMPMAHSSGDETHS